MFVRIVKMTFQQDKTADFLAHFNTHKLKIRAFKGCQFLELYQDKENPAIFFTYSYWDTTTDLDAYRASTLFKEVWKTTKNWFAAKPEAWSVNKLETLN